MWFAVFCTLIALPNSQAEQQLPEIQYDIATQAIDISKDETDTFRIRNLRKRSANLAAKGMAALEKLLNGATKYRTNSQARFYRKPGNRETALNDFNSVKPVLNRQNANTLRVRAGKRPGQVIIGTVGDRRLILMMGGDRNSGYLPVLEIRSATDVLFDRIVYKIDK